MKWYNKLLVVGIFTAIGFVAGMYIHADVKITVENPFNIVKTEKLITKQEVAQPQFEIQDMTQWEGEWEPTEKGWEEVEKVLKKEAEQLKEQEEKKAKQKRRWVKVDDVFLDALAQIESGDRDVSGDNGEAQGTLQIHKGYVDDVNRIVKENRYTYEDRHDRKRSREMTTIYLTHYSKGKNLTIEEVARIHNGGPNGYTFKCTVNYGQKFIKAYNKLI
jgi:hypothetical protein